MADHRQPELVQDQQLLRQMVFGGESGQPVGHLVDLADAGTSDLPQRYLSRLQLPLRVQGQPDVGQPQQPLVHLGLGEQIGPPGLQVQDDVHPGSGRPSHPRAQGGHAGLEGVVAVLTWSPLRYGSDDLKGRDHRYVAERLVRRRNLPRSRDAGRQVLLAEGAERGRTGVTVERDQPVPGEDDLAATRQLHTGGRDCDPGCQPPRWSKAGPDREHPPRPRRRQGLDGGGAGLADRSRGRGPLSRPPPARLWSPPWWRR